MPIAEIITIGTEIMLGEITDTNAPYIARKLRDLGIDVRRTWSIGDSIEDISDAIREARDRAEIIITTGGLGPTVDDPTREAVAKAFGVRTEFKEELWQQVIDRFARFGIFPSENNRKQAYLPLGAVPIENPVGTAPAFRMESRSCVVICLPGVPREMEHLLEEDVIPYLQARFKLQEILLVRILHTAGVGESQIDERIGDLETLSNPTVGLAAHSGQVDIRITARAKDESEANVLIQRVEKDIQQRLGNWIYGTDEETLDALAIRTLQSKGWQLVAVEAGLHGKLLRRFAHQNKVFLRGEVLPSPPSTLETFFDTTSQYRETHQSDVALGIALHSGTEKQDIYLVLITPEEQKSLRVPYGGPPKLAHRRAVNYGLDLLRKI